jgi:hypothetical protein
MTEPSLTAIIGDEIQGGDKWCDFVGGWKGRIFQRHSLQCRVVKFNPLDKKSLTEIGPDLNLTSVRVNASGGVVWCGVRANNGNHLLRAFYTAPCDKV